MEDHMPDMHNGQIEVCLHKSRLLSGPHGMYIVLHGNTCYINYFYKPQLMLRIEWEVFFDHLGKI